jgi:TolB-like protein
MSGQPNVVHAPAAGLPESIEGSGDSTAERTEKKKEKGRIRSVWISFVSRILAQLVGAAATIVLGLFALHKYQAPGTTAVAAPVTDAQPRGPLAAGTERRHGYPAVAVLPVEAYVNEPQQQQFANALTDAILTALVRDEALQVISRTSAMHYKQTGRTLPEIGRELGVDFILEGSAVKAGGRVQILIRLLDTSADEHVWAGSYIRSWRDPLSVQDAVAKAVARDVRTAALEPSHQRRRAALNIDP